jgi:hypothetical protein
LKVSQSPRILRFAILQPYAGQAKTVRAERRDFIQVEMQLTPRVAETAGLTVANR